MSKKEEDFIENLNVARDIISKFAIAEKIIRTSAKGRKYLDITLTDKTGQIDRCVNLACCDYYLVA